MYAWNTWGNVAGALLAGLVLLPALGMELLLRGTALGSAALGLVAIGLYAPRRRPTLLGMGTAVVVLVAGQLAVGPWRTEGFTLQPTRRSTEPSSFEEASSLMASYRTRALRGRPRGPPDGATGARPCWARAPWCCR